MSISLTLDNIKKITALFILPICIFLSCKKEASVLDTSVHPENDFLNVTRSDTTTIYTHTIKYDSIRSYPDRFKYLGSNQDPIFGRTDASIFTRFSMPNNISNVTFGDDVVLDSAVLVLTFTQNFVGDTNTKLNYCVYQLSQSLDPNKAYYTNNTLSYNPTPLCNATLPVKFSDGFYNVRMPLNPQFISAVISSPQYLVNNSTFINTYKGFYITTKQSNLNPSTAQGALMKMDLDNSVSGVYVYYHNGSSSASKESKLFKFLFSGDLAARFNKIDYDYNSGANPWLVSQLNGNLSSGADFLFLKGVGGSKAVINLPYLKNYSDSSRIAVNKAELILKAEQSFISTSGKYTHPLQLALVAIDSLNKEAYLKDQLLSDDLIKFGGDYDETNKQYVFNISRHVQGIVDGTFKNYGFYLVVANPDRNYVARRDDRAERIVIGGAKNSLYKTQFSLTYVRFPYDK